MYLCEERSEIFIALYKPGRDILSTPAWLILCVEMQPDGESGGEYYSEDAVGTGWLAGETETGIYYLYHSKIMGNPIMSTNTYLKV